MVQTITRPCDNPDMVPACMRGPSPEEEVAARRKKALDEDAESDVRRFRRGLLELMAYAEPELGPKVWLVVGDAEPHYVNLDPAMPLCDCGDHLNRGRICAHAICVRVFGMNEPVLDIHDDLRRDRVRRLEDAERYTAAQAKEAA